MFKKFWRKMLPAKSTYLHPKFTPQELVGYFSQYGQDKWVVETLLPNKRNGVFVDIGANDGVTLSNTYYLEKHLAWTGIAIEPIPAVFAKLAANRTCGVIEGCVGNPPGKRKFRSVTGYAEMLSGLSNEYDPRHEDRIRREVSAKGGDIQEIEVECFDFNTLLSDHGLKAVDYLTIDVEGGEWPIIKSIDFSRFDIRVIGVENNYHDGRVRDYLVQKGYRLHSVVGDDFFVRVP